MSDTALATVEDVTKRLEDEITAQMLVMIAEKIEDASDLARYHGSEAWTALTVPKRASRIVAMAVARYMANPSGLSQSRAADETLVWQDRPTVAEVYFTDIEIERLERLGKPVLPKFGSIQFTAFQSKWHPYQDSLIPIAGGGKMFPYLTEDEVRRL